MFCFPRDAEKRAKNAYFHIYNLQRAIKKKEAEVRRFDAATTVEPESLADTHDARDTELRCSGFSPLVLPSRNPI